MSVEWQTSVSRVDDGKVLIRGYDLEALIGGQSFTSSCFLLVRGRLPSPGEVRTFVRSHIGAVKAPKQVEIWPDLPRSKVGKVLKSDIRETLAASLQSPA